MVIVSRENKNILKKGQETEKKEKKQIRAINKISLIGVFVAAMVFLIASIAGVETIGFHMACFSIFMVFFVEAYEWIMVFYKKRAEREAYNAGKQKYIKIFNLLKKFKGVPLLLVFVAIVVCVSLVSFIGKYFGGYTDILCAITILGNIASLFFRLE